MSFGSSYNPFINILFPISGRYLVAPFWDDIDIGSNSGVISYEAHNSGYYLEQVSTFIARKKSANFQGAWMAVVYYDEVNSFPGSFNTLVSILNIASLIV